MFKTILVPTDGSPLSEKAVAAAVEFAKTIGGKIVAVSVAEPVPFMAFTEAVVIPSDMAEFEQKARELAQQNVQHVAAVAKAANVPCDTTIALSFSPADEIIEAARKFNCDVVFMASHGRKGLNRLFVGSETQKVLAHSMLPVVVFR